MTLVTFEINDLLEGEYTLPPFLENATELTQALEPATKKLAGIVEEEAIAYITFINPEEMQRTNNDFRHKDYATNVLSFPNYEGFRTEDDKFLILGDIVICPQVVEREAKEQNKTLEAHMKHMIIHSLLHLLGYDHMEEDEAEEMEGLEKELLAEINIADPYLLDEA